MTKNKIIVKFVNEHQHKRATLAEGRSNGVSFAFCKRNISIELKDNVREITDTYETIHAISSCKDYLNDIIYNEKTGNPITVFGQILTEPSNIFKRSKLYLAITVLPYKSDNIYNTETLPKDLEQLDQSVKTDLLQEFLQKIERKLLKTFKGKLTEIYSTDVPNIYIISLSKYWGQYSYLISLYTLLARIGILYPDKKLDVLEWLKTADINPTDKIILQTVIPKYEQLINMDILPVQDFAGQDIYGIHNTGISKFKFIENGTNKES
jgi:hypothetical protein